MADVWNMSLERWWDDTDEGNPKYSEKKLHSSAMLSTTNHTCTGLASNLGFRGDRPEPRHGPGAVIATDVINI